MSSHNRGDWYEETLRQKYNNPRLLIQVLDKMYGQGNYKVRTFMNRWILSLPQPFQAGDLDVIEDHIRFHYNPN
ncbi:hypothetical protein QBC34DRAFT_409821 [Podospora aff. communis PSN243]|uniref:Uncharacterized protein n=1 Tax=Podospora aff. communis PSN243 TaxID=3040156 RepID=A0AAV9GGK6_9PEZI|nr:hypothetical protein QBC34DRAFT_409821 [Podospora aff. communis PSN243]